MARTFLIDTDTASDDAVALIMALRAPDIDIKAVTAVSGNVNVDQAVTNALYTVELCGADVPVYRGAARPLLREPERAEWFHGADGLGNQHYPAPRRSAADGSALDAIIDTVETNPGIEIVTLGPLTNLALAISARPQLFQTHVRRCVVMGGAANTVGNVTPAAEFNIWHDPEAARIVFRSGMPVEMVGWELCRFDAIITPQEIDQLRALHTPLADFTVDCNATAIAAAHEQSGESGIALPDPVAMAVALDPSICTRSSRHAVDIEIHSTLTRGMTVIDQLDVTHDERNREQWQVVRAQGQVRVCWQIDVPRWKQMLFAAVAERGDS